MVGEVVEIGIDCEEISNFNEEDLTPEFLRKVFTQAEIDYCNSKKPSSQHFAGRFAAKEAVIKALSNYGLQLTPSQIDVTSHETGYPEVKVECHLPEGIEIKISITHALDLAIAVAVAAPTRN